VILRDLCSVGIAPCEVVRLAQLVWTNRALIAQTATFDRLVLIRVLVRINKLFLQPTYIRDWPLAEQYRLLTTVGFVYDTVLEFVRADKVLLAQVPLDGLVGLFLAGDDLFPVPSRIITSYYSAIGREYGVHAGIRDKFFLGAHEFALSSSSVSWVSTVAQRIVHRYEESVGDKEACAKISALLLLVMLQDRDLERELCLSKYQQFVQQVRNHLAK